MKIVIGKKYQYNFKPIRVIAIGNHNVVYTDGIKTYTDKIDNFLVNASELGLSLKYKTNSVLNLDKPIVEPIGSPVEPVEPVGPPVEPVEPIGPPVEPVGPPVEPVGPPVEPVIEPVDPGTIENPYGNDYI